MRRWNASRPILPQFKYTKQETSCSQRTHVTQKLNQCSSTSSKHSGTNLSISLIKRPKCFNLSKTLDKSKAHRSTVAYLMLEYSFIFWPHLGQRFPSFELFLERVFDAQLFRKSSRWRHSSEIRYQHLPMKYTEIGGVSGGSANPEHTGGVWVRGLDWHFSPCNVQ